MLRNFLRRTLTWNSLLELSTVDHPYYGDILCQKVLYVKRVLGDQWSSCVNICEEWVVIDFWGVR